MKTLVYILPDKDAGVASVVRNLLKFKTNRYETKALLLHNLLDDGNRRIKDNFNADNIVRITYHGKWSSKLSVYKKIIKELDPNSIVVSNDGGIELDALGYSRCSVPVIYVLHGDIKHYYNAIQKNQNRIRAIVTVSDFLKFKLKTISSDIVIESIKFPVPDAQYLNRIEDSSKIRLVFVGSLISAKGIFDLESILKQLESKSIPFSLNIIGSGVEEQRLKVALKTFKSIQFKGKLPNVDVLKLHKNHDIIILPSKTEGLPVVLVEAMKHGVIPMATNLESGIPELIEHGVNGFTIPLDEVSNYANYIEQLHHNRSQLKKMRELCIKKSEQLFNPNKQAKKYENLFCTIIAAQHQPVKNLLDYLPMAISYKIKTYFKK